MTPGLRLERPGDLRSAADFRLAASNLAVWACNGAAGRPSLGDPVYQAVTEDRQEQTAAAARRWDRTEPHKRTGRRPFYSSCGDLPHWLFYRLGFRHTWINRVEHRGWRVGWNIALLTPPGCKLAQPARGSFAPEVGDVLHVRGAFDHVRVIVDMAAGEWTSADYGQPGGKLRSWPLLERPGGWFAGTARIVNWLPLSAVRDSATGEREPAELVDG